MFIPLLLFVYVCDTIVSGQFEIPRAKVEVFYPMGFRVSIPDTEGIKLFAFHGKINEEMDGREAGSFSRDITTAKGGRWTFFEPNAKLQIGDTLYYWTYVQYSAGGKLLGFPTDDQEFHVTALIGQPPASELSSVPNSPPSKPKPIPKPAPAASNNGCFGTITKVKNNDKVCGDQLIFNEEFKTLSPNQWKPQIKFAGGPDFEFVLYHDMPDLLSVKDNQLHIRPLLTDNIYGQGFTTKSNGLDLGENCTGIPDSEECFQKPDAFLILPPVMSAKISSKFAFKYGKVEIRAKLPQGDWIYPELFLDPKEEAYGSGYQSGQIRIAFMPGNAGMSNVLYGGCVLGSSKAARHYGLRNFKKDTSWGGEFHNFWLVWTDERITMGVDDTTYGNVHPPAGGFVAERFSLNLVNSDNWKDGGHMAPFDQLMSLTLGVGVGGHYFDDKGGGIKPWSNTDPKAQINFYKARSKWYPTWGAQSTLVVDHVKIWAI